MKRKNSRHFARRARIVYSVPVQLRDGAVMYLIVDGKGVYLDTRNANPPILIMSLNKLRDIRRSGGLSLSGLEDFREPRTYR